MTLIKTFFHLIIDTEEDIYSKFVAFVLKYYKHSKSVFPDFLKDHTLCDFAPVKKYDTTKNCIFGTMQFVF